MSLPEYDIFCLNIECFLLLDSLLTSQSNCLNNINKISINRGVLNTR